MPQSTTCNFCGKAFAVLPSFWFRNIVLSALNCCVVVVFFCLIATSLSSLFIHIVSWFSTEQVKANPDFHISPTFFSESLQDSHCPGISPAYVLFYFVSFCFFSATEQKYSGYIKTQGFPSLKATERGGEQSLATATITARAANHPQTTLNSLPGWAASVFALCVYRNIITKLW